MQLFKNLKAFFSAIICEVHLPVSRCETEERQGVMWLKCQSLRSLNLRLAGGIFMSSYHFTVKTDTKSDGSRISASVHVDYISRQGKYKNAGDDKNNETNFIAFANSKNLGEETFPLYLTDDFGKKYFRQSTFNFARQ